MKTNIYRLLLNIISCFFIVILLGQCNMDSRQEDEPEKDWEGMKTLMNYIGAKKVLEKELLDQSKIMIFNDTLVGLNLVTDRFFVQSLKDTSFYKVIKVNQNAPTYFRPPERKNDLGEQEQYYFHYFKNGCIYFGNIRDQIDKICLDGSHQAVLTDSAMEQKKGLKITSLGQFMYHEGLIIQGTHSGIYIFEEKTGDLVWKFINKHRYGIASLWGPIKVGPHLVFMSLHKDPDNEKTVIRGVNLNELGEPWTTTIQDLPEYGLAGNYSDIATFRGKRTGKTYFVNAKTGDIILKTGYEAGLPSKSQPYFYSNVFSTISDDYAYVFTGTYKSKYGPLSRGTGKLDIRRDKILWKKNANAIFTYNDYVILRKDTRNKGYNIDSIDKMLVVDRKSGKTLKTIDFVKEIPSFDFYNGYIKLGNALYK